MAAVQGVENPVLRLQAVGALLASGEQLRAVRRATMAELRSETWTWAEIGAVISSGAERAWQVGNGR